MKTTPPPKFKRTRRHVVARLTPLEAEAIAAMAIMAARHRDGIPARLRRTAARLTDQLVFAAKLGEVDPPRQPAPKKKFQLWKGDSDR